MVEEAIGYQIYLKSFKIVIMMAILMELKAPLFKGNYFNLDNTILLITDG